MNDPTFIFSGDHTEPFSPGVSQSDGEDAEKKKESHIECEVLHLMQDQVIGHQQKRSLCYLIQPSPLRLFGNFLVLRHLPLF